MRTTEGDSGTDAATDKWLTPGVAGIGTASLLADVGEGAPHAAKPSHRVARVHSSKS